ncbi:MAG TPA: GNAT family N-acetyltransferase [Candidatus Dormibacteraeota bacterium]|nr:GNAT family N-acetyltransferase [Candidatus Dormibacteraeota bacterium]
MRRIGPEDWKVFREVRLAALREAPYAFGSTYEGEAGASEESWRNRLRDRTRFVAIVDGQVVGTVAAGTGEFTGAAALTALWVDPRFRGQGVGTALIDAVMEWARSEQFDQVLLWVTEVNETAARLYEHHGFTRTGRVSDVRRGEAAVEHEMSRGI